eukprot:11404877-Karenia_brevis.AAC.1
MRPRKTLFTPTGTKNEPPLNELEKFRVMDIKICDGGGKQTVHDQWLTHDGQHRALKKRWT